MSENENYDANVSLPGNDLMPTFTTQKFQVIEQIEEKTAGFGPLWWTY